MIKTKEFCTKYVSIDDKINEFLASNNIQGHHLIDIKYVVSNKLRYALVIYRELRNSCI